MELDVKKTQTIQLNGKKATQVDFWANIKQFLRRLLLSEYFVLYLSIIYFVVLWPVVPRIASAQNLGNIFSNMWPLLAVAIGQTFVLIIAGIDLSQPSIMALVSVVGAVVITTQVDPVLFEKSPLWGVLLTEQGGPLAGSVLSVPVAIIVMLLVGAMIGFFNGTSIARWKMPPFMVTLVSMMFFSAFAIYLTKSENIIHLPAAYKVIGQGQISFIPYSLFIVGGLAIVAHIALSRTVFGRWLYAIGTNTRTAVVSGVPVTRVIILAYMLSGAFAAVGSVLYSARLEAGRPTLGATLLLDVIGATVIGGTSLFGGKGKIVWTVFGVLFFVLLDNSLNLLNLSYFTVMIVKGSVILLAALFDVTRTRILARS
ncbi:MAG: Ribose import permease protein RbsC [Anaerolineae bacterium]|nr:Ribose import permease protein RbsC [Anaerolineae bacterium]